MVTEKARPERRAALLRTRVRDDGGWSNMTICNVSERGMMLRGERVPARGTIIEIRCGATSVVADVRWSTSGQCGVRSREMIDVEELLRGGNLKTSRRGSIEERRAQVRPVDHKAQAERSRVIGRLIDDALIAALVMVGAVLLGAAVTGFLRSPFSQIQSRLANTP